MNRTEFERMAPPLRKRIVSMVLSMSASADADLADDVAQDTLLRLWTIREKLDEYRSVDSLAMVIARHRAIDLLRESSSLSVGLDDIDTGHSVPSPEESMIESEDCSDVFGIIASLPSVQQTVIRMRHIEGLEIADIAKITGSTPGSIRVALSRARQSIKEIFMQHQS
ncbi:sigma-70 family RNA polymerase sigma factor [uncultured Duncaniella sp.]|uniref:RNA polymerase sigma factor n=1 Tax=uncultured Duncaniella sp. TaxID=2768039 RepID=UPI0023CA4136|nr:sigma-70 family RNA polymerase sigma factor [uncultured Duncaniella sp.]MDE5665898.1 sigma-70 family RNA polymerase sigma factor [Duncaniella sp.]MDE5672076.1 sigma-70 family RNA polymerase sigma factor [Duncaniella sp.]MDE5915549.1 sigma-70 family RNA polymerase sigma factor [Duncaniella sp.]MDE5953957.1 sigma-70 family RNA polymerase sigma factor [Duncaniella sp.]MDE5960194.1 sigma-70 family RNA polymerase sigma factor [Duncaniella sp.]